jgi:integrase
LRNSLFRTDHRGGYRDKVRSRHAYGAGLRVSEVVALKVLDVDSERMLLRIEQGNGRKDRFAMLSPQLLEVERDGEEERSAETALLTLGARTPLSVRCS